MRDLRPDTRPRRPDEGTDYSGHGCCVSNSGLDRFAASSGFLGIVGLIAALIAGNKGWARMIAYDRALEKAEPKPSDVEMDKLLAVDLRTIIDRGMESLSLTTDDLVSVAQQWDPIANLSQEASHIDTQHARPMVVFGPAIPSRAMVGKDQVWRFSSYEVMVICPTGYHLAIYRTGLNFLTGALRQEETHEYHYSDVVAVSTVSSPGRELGELAVDSATDVDADQVRFAKTILREFQIVVASGDRSKVVAGIADESDPERQARLQESGIEQVIASVRRILREKKAGPPRRLHPRKHSTPN